MNLYSVQNMLHMYFTQTYLGNTNVTCDTKTPMWCCKFAMLPKHNCVYAVCNHFYIFEEDSQNTLSGNKTRFSSINRRKDPDQDTSVCKHMSDGLASFTESKYFTEQYLKKSSENGDKTPHECVKCKKRFKNKSCATKMPSKDEVLI